MFLQTFGLCYSIDGVSNYEGDNLNSNDYQENIVKYVFSNGVLQKYNDDFISGRFLLIKVYGVENGNGKGVAYIFYKK